MYNQKDGIYLTGVRGQRCFKIFNHLTIHKKSQIIAFHQTFSFVWATEYTNYGKMEQKNSYKVYYHLHKHLKLMCDGNSRYKG